MQKSGSESTRYFFDNPVNLDFGLRTPGFGRWSGSSPKFNHLVPGLCPTLQEISSKFVHNFFSYPTDRQTDRSKNIASFFSGGNDSTVWMSVQNYWNKRRKTHLKINNLRALKLFWSTWKSSCSLYDAVTSIVNVEIVLYVGTLAVCGRIESLQLQRISINYKWSKRDAQNYIFLTAILKHIKLPAYDHS